ncbi:MAG: hypothetical protein AAF642_02385 [Pseudomonadota bacterium]
MRFLEEEDHVTVIPLESESDEHCVEAINILASQVDANLASRSCGGEFKVFFRLREAPEQESEILSEKMFFQAVARRGPLFREPLESLIERYCDHVVEHLYSDPDEAEGLFAFAAFALARIAPERLGLFDRFGDLCDQEHEHIYARQTVRELLSVSPYDEARHAFAIKFMAKEFYNSVDEYDVWRGYGVYDNAQTTHSPAAYARLVHSVADKISPDYSEDSQLGLIAFDYLEEAFGSFERNGRYGAAGFRTPWERELFTHLRDLSLAKQQK